MKSQLGLQQMTDNISFIFSGKNLRFIFHVEEWWFNLFPAILVMKKSSAYNVCSIYAITL